jgi:uncharacterized protein YdaU (DUF1376 family)
MHYYSHNIGDYRRDTSHLSLIEHGVYRQLMDTYYLSEKPLTKDHADLMRTHCARTADEMQAVENVLKDFFVITPEGYIHKRCDVEIEAFHSKSSSASESAKTRWARVRAEKEAEAMRTHSEGNTNQEPTTNNQQPRTYKEPKGDQQADAEQKSVRRNWVKELVGLGVEEKFAKDWMAVRKAKKASMTDTALEAIQREAGIAGITFGEAVRIAAENSWQGFKAAWVNKAGQSGVVQFMTKQERIEAANQQVLLEMNAAEDARIAAMGAQPVRLDDQGFIIEGDFFHAT